MKREILIDVNEDEIRVALVEDGKIVELFIERSNDKDIVGNVYIARVVNVVSGIQSAFLDVGHGRDVFLPIEETHIKKGDKVLVQILKESIGNKAARATTEISLPGRYLVYTPGNNKTGISRNIIDEKERFRLKDIIKSFNMKKGGFIVRTEAERHKEKDLIRDSQYLTKLWDTIEREKHSQTPKLVHRAFGIVFYAVRELFTDDVNMLYVNSKKEFRDILGYIKMVAPELKRKITFYRKDIPLFEMHAIENQIRDMKRQKLSLPCGGSIVIQQTEALVAVDVNTGSYTSGKDREESAFMANCQAAKEIAHQLRLRNVGGIIIIDFIDMDFAKHRQKILETLQAAIKNDKAKIDILPITRMGLLEMTRQRKRESIYNILCQSCPYCEGSGVVFSEITMYIKIKKEMLKTIPRLKAREIDVFMHPRVAAMFDDKNLQHISRMVRKKVRVRPDYKMHHEEFEIKEYK